MSGAVALGAAECRLKTGAGLSMRFFSHHRRHRYHGAALRSAISDLVAAMAWGGVA
jgi:hypothetical protein